MNTYNQHISSLSAGIADCVAGSEKFKDASENFIRMANQKYTKETDEKMIHFTQNFVNELTYLTKRHEDQLLFKIGFYNKMPEDERNPNRKYDFKESKIDKSQLF